MKRASFILASWLGLAGAASGCIDTFGDDDFDVSPDPNTATAALRAVHLSPGASEVDIWLNGTGPAIDGLRYAQGTRFLNVSSGAYDVNVTAAEGGLSATLASLGKVPLMATSSSTIVIFGTPGALEAMTFEEKLSPASAGMAKLRFVHLASGFDSLDFLDVTDPDAPALIEGDLPYRARADAFEWPVADSATPALSVGIDVDDDQSPEAVFELSDLTDGTIANLYAVTGASGELVLVSQEADGTVSEIGQPEVVEPEPAQIRGLNVSFGSPLLDIEVAGPQLAVATDLELGKSSSFLPIDPGTYSFVVAKSEDATSLVELDPADLLPGARYTVAAFGHFDSIDGLLLADAPQVVAAGMFRARLVHTAATLGQIDLWDYTDQLDPMLLDQNINFGTAGSYVDLPVGIGYVLAVDANADDAPDAVFELPDLPEGEVVNLFATSQGPDTVYLYTQLTSGDVVAIEGTSKLP